MQTALAKGGAACDFALRFDGREARVRATAAAAGALAPCVAFGGPDQALKSAAAALAVKFVDGHVNVQGDLLPLGLHTVGEYSMFRQPVKADGFWGCPQRLSGRQPPLQLCGGRAPREPRAAPLKDARRSVQGAAETFCAHTVLHRSSQSRRPGYLLLACNIFQAAIPPPRFFAAPNPCRSKYSATTRLLSPTAH